MIPTWQVCAIVVVLTSFAACAVLTACVSAAQQAAVAADALEQRECIDNAEAGVGKAALKAEIDACRDRVKARRDGGQ